MSSESRIASIASHLAPFHVGDEKLGKLLAHSVGRLMLRSVKTGEDVRYDFPDEKIRHVADWLKTSLVNGAEWLSNVDDKGRAKKLLKYPTFEALLAEVDRTMVIEAQKLGNVRLVEGDEVVHAHLSDGMVLIQLLTPTALDRESSVMQHCIGNGGYDDLLGRDDHLFLSLRDCHGKAHATLEIKNGVITQFQGKQNKPPIQKYVDILVPFIKHRGFGVSVRSAHLGYVIDKNGDWHDIDHLPDGLTVFGDLDLTESGITVLPDGLTVGGGLYLSYTRITVLPEGLTVGGDLYLRGTGITDLPDGLIVGRDLDITKTGITVLPDGLTVCGGLYFSDTRITALPDRLSVGRGLYLRGTGITVLPDGLTVGGDLNLSGTRITALPDGLTVGGGLYLTDTGVSVLPDGLTVGGGLYLSRTAIAALPDRLTVGGDLNLSGTCITALPEGLAVGGDLYLSRTAITVLPEGIKDCARICCDEGFLSAKAFRHRFYTDATVRPPVMDHG